MQDRDVVRLLRERRVERLGILARQIQPQDLIRGQIAGGLARGGPPLATRAPCRPRRPRPPPPGARRGGARADEGEEAFLWHVGPFPVPRRRGLRPGPSGWFGHVPILSVD